jgi:hypothetical protein
MVCEPTPDREVMKSKAKSLKYLSLPLLPVPASFSVLGFRPFMT